MSGVPDHPRQAPFATVATRLSQRSFTRISR